MENNTSNLSIHPHPSYPLHSPHPHHFSDKKHKNDGIITSICLICQASYLMLFDRNRQGIGQRRYFQGREREWPSAGHKIRPHQIQPIKFNASYSRIIKTHPLELPQNSNSKWQKKLNDQSPRRQPPRPRPPSHPPKLENHQQRQRPQRPPSLLHPLPLPLHQSPPQHLLPLLPPPSPSPSLPRSPRLLRLNLPQSQRPPNLPQSQRLLPPRARKLLRRLPLKLPRRSPRSESDGQLHLHTNKLTNNELKSNDIGLFQRQKKGFWMWG